MPQPRAAITQKDLERAIKAAKRQGWKSVVVEVPNGIKIRLSEDLAEKPVEDVPEITL